jgi:hypothetical protein
MSAETPNQSRTVTMPTALWELVDQIAAEHGRHWAEVVRELIGNSAREKQIELLTVEAKKAVVKKMRQRQGKMLDALVVLKNSNSSTEKLAGIAIIEEGLRD